MIHSTLVEAEVLRIVRDHHVDGMEGPHLLGRIQFQTCQGIHVHTALHRKQSLRQLQVGHLHAVVGHALATLHRLQRQIVGERCLAVARLRTDDDEGIVGQTSLAIELRDARHQTDVLRLGIAVVDDVLAGYLELLGQRSEVLALRARHDLVDGLLDGVHARIEFGAEGVAQLEQLVAHGSQGAALGDVLQHEHHLEEVHLFLHLGGDLRHLEHAVLGLLVVHAVHQFVRHRDHRDRRVGAIHIADGVVDHLMHGFVETVVVETLHRLVDALTFIHQAIQHSRFHLLVAQHLPGKLRNLNLVFHCCCCFKKTKNEPLG